MSPRLRYSVDYYSSFSIFPGDPLVLLGAILSDQIFFPHLRTQFFQSSSNMSTILYIFFEIHNCLMIILCCKFNKCNKNFEILDKSYVLNFLWNFDFYFIFITNFLGQKEYFLHQEYQSGYASNRDPGR